MRRLAAVLVSLSVVAAGCSSDTGASYSDCDDLAQGGLDLLQDILDEVSDLSMEQFLDAASQETPEFIAKYDSRADQLDAAQIDLGCTDDQLRSYLVDNINQLSASGAVGELMLEAILADPNGILAD